MKFNLLNMGRRALGAAASAAAKVPALDCRFHISRRMQGPWLPEGSVGPCLWMHGASLGECRMLLNLAKALKEDLADCPKILITTQKVEVVSFLKDAGGKFVDAALAPADAPSAMSGFVRGVQPIGLILAENELWPGFLSTMARLSVRPSVALVSGRYRRSLPGIDFSGVGYVSMQTESDWLRLALASGSRLPMRVGGDWKLLDWARSGELVCPPQEPKVDSVFVSFHMEEWDSLCAMLVSAVKKGESIVLAPRRLSEVNQFRRALQGEEFRVVEWPQVQKGVVSLVTRFGLTGEIFSVSRSAVVGGSFARGLGVHDFWEPLRFGLATAVGPVVTGHEDAVADLCRQGALVQLRRAADYSHRTFPTISVVQECLRREKLKVSDSYQQLLLFLKDLL